MGAWREGIIFGWAVYSSPLIPCPGDNGGNLFPTARLHFFSNHSTFWCFLPSEPPYAASVSPGKSHTPVRTSYRACDAQD